MTKSPLLTANTATWIDVPAGQLTDKYKIHLKCGRPVGSKDVTPKKKKTQEKLDTLKYAIKMIDQSKIDKSITPEKYK